MEGRLYVPSSLVTSVCVCAEIVEGRKKGPFSGLQIAYYSMREARKPRKILRELLLLVQKPSGGYVAAPLGEASQADPWSLGRIWLVKRKLGDSRRPK